MPRRANFIRLRILTGTLTFDNARTLPVMLTGTHNILAGKPGCFFDLFAGANLASVTLKRTYDAGKAEWLQPVAQQHGWRVLRRRIDYIRGEEEYDINTGAGRELAGLAIIRTLPDVACISFGADEGDSVEAMRIVAIPRGTLIAPVGGSVSADAVRQKIAPVFLGASEFAVTRAADDVDFSISLRAPGKFYGMTQFAADMFDVVLKLQPGLGPTGAGDIRDMARVGVVKVTRLADKGRSRWT